MLALALAVAFTMFTEVSLPLARDSAAQTKATPLFALSSPVLVPPQDGSARPAPADSAENGEWVWTAIYRGNASRPPHLAEQWTSQVGQDRTIVDVFGGKRNGFFLDLAANDASHFSNTLTLEQQFGWHGICVEANPEYRQSFAGRTCRLAQAVVGPHDNERVHFVFENLLGGIEGFDQSLSINGTDLLTVSVARLLGDFGAPAIIDYLSLDIEGAEWWAFSTFPWHRFVFLTITIERPAIELRMKLLEASAALRAYMRVHVLFLTTRAHSQSRRATHTFAHMATLATISLYTSPSIITSQYSRNSRERDAEENKWGEKMVIYRHSNWRRPEDFLPSHMSFSGLSQSLGSSHASICPGAKTLQPAGQPQKSEQFLGERAATGQLLRKK